MASPDHCTHLPRCRHDDTAVAWALCGLTTAAARSEVSVAVQLFSLGPDGLEIDGMTRLHHDAHGPALAAVSEASKVAALAHVLGLEVEVDDHV